MMVSTAFTPRWPWTGWAWAAAAALGLHALALQGLQPEAPGSGAAPALPPAPALRWVQLQPAQNSPAAPSGVAAQAPVTPSPAAARPADAQPMGSVAPRRVWAEAAPVPDTPPAPEPATPSDAEDGPVPGADARREIASRPVPRYAARLPAPFQLRFALQRGDIRGQGELRFEHDTASGRYQLQLLLQGPQRPMWEQSSTGSAQGHGLQPEQFHDRRRGRRIGTADFDRAAGQVRFSGKAPPLPIAEAAQDRLSWMVQLPAALAADAALQRPGSTVWLQVFSARGDVQLWAFEVQGLQAVAMGDGSTVEALHVRRLPERLYDTQIDAWLDPAGQFLPVQLWLTHWPTGERMTLTRQGP
jgi:Protein of unknown function (DUF3108)